MSTLYLRKKPGPDPAMPQAIKWQMKPQLNMTTTTLPKAIAYRDTMNSSMESATPLSLETFRTLPILNIFMHLSNLPIFRRRAVFMRENAGPVSIASQGKLDMKSRVNQLFR